MSANENYELAVRMVADGAEETADQVNNVGEQFDETTESVEDGADEADDAAAAYVGAMQSIVTGLAVASAGLLTQVPVLGGVFEGLRSIIDAVAFQMDKVLRPILQPVADAMFQLSDAIFNAEGPLGTLIGVLGTLAAVFLPVLAVAFKVKGVMTTLGAIWNAITGAAGAVAGALQNLIGWFAAGSTGALAAAGALGALIGTFAVFVLEATGVNDAIESLGRGLGNSVPNAVRNASLALLSLVAGPLAVLGGAVRGFVQGVMEDGLVGGIKGAADGALQVVRIFAQSWRSLFDTLVSAMFDYGRDLMGELANGIKAAATAPIDAAKGALDGIKDKISFDQPANDRMARGWGQDLLTEFSVGMKQATERATVSLSPSEGGSGGSERPVSQTPALEVNLDGRRVNNQQRKRQGRARRARQRDGT